MPSCSDLVMVALSTLPALSATISMSRPAEYASTDVLSISAVVPPYFFRYAPTNSALPLAFEPGNQSPELKMPLTFSRPTFAGNSTGEFAPLATYRNLGAQPSATRSLTAA